MSFTRQFDGNATGRRTLTVKWTTPTIRHPGVANANMLFFVLPMLREVESCIDSRF